jgi:hypothetical protein
VRAFLNFYQPFAERAASATLVEHEAAHALALDANNVDAMIARLFVLPPFGKFVEAGAILERIQRAPGSGDGSRYIGWYLRTMGHIRESLEDTERTYRLDVLEWHWQGWPLVRSQRQSLSTRTSWRGCQI